LLCSTAAQRIGEFPLAAMNTDALFEMWVVNSKGKTLFATYNRCEWIFTADLVVVNTNRTDKIGKIDNLTLIVKKQIFVH
jgi:hypothetical protein